MYNELYKEYSPVLMLKDYSEEDILNILKIERSYLRNIEFFTRFNNIKHTISQIKLGKPVFLFYLCEAKIEDWLDVVFVGSEYDFGLWKLSWQAMAVEQIKKYPNKTFYINTKYVDRIKVALPSNVSVNLKYESELLTIK